MRPLPVWCRALAAFSLGVALLLRGPPAEAQEASRAAARKASPLRLPRLVVHRTDDTADCPDASALAGLVARHMKRPALEPLDDARSSLAPSVRGAAPLPSVDVQIYRSEEGYTAVVQTEVAAMAEAAPSAARIKTRQLSDKGSTCAGLAAALSITLAILLDTEIPPPPSSPEPPPALDRAPSASPAPPEPPPLLRSRDAAESATAMGPEDADRPASSAGRKNPDRRAASVGRDAVDQGAASARSLGLTAGLGLAAAAGALQYGGLASAGYLELRIGRWLSLAGGVMAFAAQTFPLPFAVPGAELGKPQVAVWLTVGLLRGCVMVPVFTPLASEERAPATRDQTRAGGCLGLLAGAIHGEASDLPKRSPATDPWVAGEASGIVEQRLFWRFSLVTRAALLIPLVRRAFVVEQVGTAFTPAPLGVALNTELRLSIW
jgi:hypothetical protein